MDFNILVGTMTGTAELVAGDIKKKLEAEGHKADLLLMDNLKADVFQRPGIFLICTSTYGQGDVPDNARDFHADLRNAKPDLSGKLVGIIGLGDSTYVDTFNHGGRQFEDVLRDCGVTLVGERMEHNASGGTMAEDDALAWVEEWIKLLGPHAQAA